MSNWSERFMIYSITFESLYVSFLPGTVFISPHSQFFFCFKDKWNGLRAKYCNNDCSFREFVVSKAGLRHW